VRADGGVASFPHAIQARADSTHSELDDSWADMETLGRTLLVFAVVLAVVGGIVLLFSRVGMSRLPGDILIRGKNVTFYFPLGLSIAVSVLLTVVLNLFWRR